MEKIVYNTLKMNSTSWVSRIGITKKYTRVKDFGVSTIKLN